MSAGLIINIMIYCALIIHNEMNVELGLQAIDVVAIVELPRAAV